MADTEDGLTRAKLNGLVSPASALRLFYPGDKAPPPDFDPSTLPIAIGNARILQAQAESVAAMFRDHGFALIEHRTSLSDWGLSPSAQEAVARLYHPEIEAIVRQVLFPGQRVEVDQRLGHLCRGGPDDVIYADWVHQDFGLTAEDFARNLAGVASPQVGEAWQARYDQADVAGCVVISFWRTIGMRGPLRHQPLALCDPGSVAMEDVIANTPAADGGAYHIGLRYNAGQRWRHYPGMRADELLAFKLFECRKDDPGPSRLRSVFHSAFDDPAMPEDAERRHSCEHRVIVLVLAD